MLGAFVLKEKLKVLNGKLNVWNMDHFGHIQRRKKTNRIVVEQS